MTEHLTRHSAEHDDDFTGHEDGREPDTAGVPGDRADFREPGVDEGYDADRDADRDTDLDRDGDQNLSTADLASASAQPTADDGHADATPAQSGGDVEAPAKSGGDVEAQPLIDEDKVTGFRDRWQNVQTGFVDDPKQAVHQADELVAAVISALATTFAEHKSELEGQWRQGEPATEELRIALRRYRSFFDQLLPR
ncbi:Uncharacterised protein [Amycolatopsis camponoti]|uniref:Uncharacterized protein n=1 Tax=Amycolatopsis camponoti TaxID=2606593 RepID=A0A6I8LV83_9PSEU|nr:hypothetical protein [Amycolatopsis camponoti]VVJ21072.1 Uncharacterised protein [Amycolatopsis camponoti]